MIDRPGREELALRLRRLASGRITNDDYDDDYPVRSSDPGLEAVSRAGWILYSDYSSYRLRGRNALKPETLRAVARCILFLHSDLEYEWPKEPRHGVVGIMIAILTFGRVDTRPWKAWRALGDYDVWPFFRRSDLDEVSARPRFLSGRSNAAA